MSERQGTKYRRHYTRDPVWGVAIIATLSWIGVVLMAFTAPDGWTVGGAAFLAIVTAAYVVVLWRILQWGVWVDDEGVLVVNFFSTIGKIPWGEIRQFRLGREAFVGIAAALERKGGAVAWCSGVQHRWLSSIERAERKAAGRVVAALNAELREHQRE